MPNYKFSFLYVPAAEIGAITISEQSFLGSFYKKKELKAPQDASKSGVVAIPVPDLPTFDYTIDLVAFSKSIYLFIAGLSLLAFLLSIIQLTKFLRNTEQEIADEIIVCKSKINVPPFSFFKYLVIDSGKFSKQDLEKIISHEKVHIFQWHSVDILLCKILTCLLWFNPMVFIFQRYLKLNLEYLADDHVIKAGIDKETYQRSILQTSLSAHAFILTNQFFSPKIKNRILMMNSKKSHRPNLIKYAMVIPCIFAYFIFGSFIAKEPAKRNDAASFSQSSAIPKVTQPELAIIEGYYKSKNVIRKGENDFLKMYIKDNHIVVRELWSSLEIDLSQQTPLTFNGINRSYPVVFSKNNLGKIIQATIYGNDVWEKIEKYEPQIKPATVLVPAKIEKLIGFYESINNKFAMIEVSAAGNKILIKPLWKENAATYVPVSDLDFVDEDKDSYTTISFSEPLSGNISIIRGDRQIFTKMNSYQPLPEVKLSSTALSKLEGKYTILWEGQKVPTDTIQFKASPEGLLFTELYRPVQKWERLIGLSETIFKSSLNPMSIEFYDDKNGNTTKCQFHFPHEKNIWNKVN